MNGAGGQKYLSPDHQAKTHFNVPIYHILRVTCLPPAPGSVAAAEERELAHVETSRKTKGARMNGA